MSKWRGLRGLAPLVAPEGRFGGRLDRLEEERHTAVAVVGVVEEDVAGLESLVEDVVANPRALAVHRGDIRSLCLPPASKGHWTP